MAIRGLGIEYKTFLPMINNPHTPFSGGVGAQLDTGFGIQLDWLAERRTYHIPIRWAEMEAEGFYTPLQGVMDLVNLVRAKDSTLIIGVKVAPQMYREWPLHGSPIAKAYYPQFASFLKWLCELYKPDAIELFNEPNVDKRAINNELQWYYGAQVVDSDYYKAGIVYGEMTQAVYETLANQNVRLLAGAVNGEITSIPFLQGMVDGGLKADYVSFHWYIWERKFPSIFDFAVEVQDIVNLPLICTETNFLGKTNYPNLRQNQADYITYLRSTSQSVLDAILVYAMAGSWYYCGMMEEGLPTIAWEAWAK